MHHIVIIYDSITNSVFLGQVLQPLITIAQKKPVIILSYEKNNPPHELITHIQSYNITLIIFKKFSRIFLIGLLYDILRAHYYLKQYASYMLQARGPLAGCIARSLLFNSSCKQLTLQVRGLLAEEYRYAHKKTYFNMYYYAYILIEKIAYMPHKKIILEAVSPALKEYLHKKFFISRHALTVASQDIPPLISSNTKLKWRTGIRKQLSISHDTYVYCYNGSCKPWQCPDKTIAYFKRIFERKKKYFLTNSYSRCTKI